MPRAFNVSKVSWEFSLALRSNATSCRPCNGVETSASAREGEVDGCWVSEQLGDFAGELTVGAGGQRPGTSERAMFDRRFGVPHLVEGGAVLVAAPYLQRGVINLQEVRLVVGQGVELTGEAVEVGALEHASCGVHQQLQGGESLLPVDDVAGREMPRLQLVRLHHDRAEEVGRLAEGIPLSRLDQPADVLPERRLLVLLVPHIRPLEQRHHQLLRQIEDLYGSAHGCFHGDILPRCAGLAQRGLGGKPEWLPVMPRN